MPQEEILDCRKCISDVSDNGAYLLQLSLKVDFGEAKKCLEKMLEDERIFDCFIVQPSESGKMLLCFGQIGVKEQFKRSLIKRIFS